MNIAIIRKKYSFHGGAENFSASFIENLAREGQTIHIFSIQWESDIKHENVYFHKVPAITSISLLRDLSFAVSSFFILKKQRKNFDIIQSHDKTLYQDIYRAGDGCHKEWLKQRWKRIGIFRKISIILNPYHWLILLLERVIFKKHRFKKVLAISQLVKNNIIKNYSVSSDDIEVIYNGVDTDRFHPDNKGRYRDKIRQQYGLGQNDFVVLFVGSGFERKGVHYLIKACESVPGQVTILIVGKGPQNKLRHMAKKQKLIFCGPQKDIHQYYAAADLFVFPTLYEPFGNVHLEALASGLPVITTKQSGASEIITDGKQGYVIEKAEDTKVIAEKISVLMDRNTNRRAGHEARKLAEEFTYDKYMQEVKFLYAKILNENK